jgi:UPF0042 nucleotide-binding protein
MVGSPPSPPTDGRPAENPDESSDHPNSKSRSQRSRLVVVTGLAGSGKTVAIRALEDLGFHCIDNLPSIMLADLVTSIISGHLKYQNIALALDTRDPLAVPTLISRSETLRQFFQFEILFVEADENTVLKRFRETRRRHPLSAPPANEEGSASTRSLPEQPPLALRSAIALDIQTLKPIRDIADRVIDTTQMTADFLRKLIRSTYATKMESYEVHINIVSFGFKHGVPQDLDTLFDVRCFKNPHYQDDLRPRTGLDKQVQDYVFSDPNVSEFIGRIYDLLLFLYPMYCNEGKKYFGLGIGCTGGKHRSVAIAEELHRMLHSTLPYVSVEHRHFDRE